MVGFALLTAWGLQLVSTGRSVVLAYTTPLWVIPAARVFLGERLKLRRAVGAGVGLLGLSVLFNPLAFDWTGRGTILGNAAILLADGPGLMTHRGAGPGARLPCLELASVRFALSCFRELSDAPIAPKS